MTTRRHILLTILLALALVVTASAISDAYGEATSPKAPTATLSGTSLAEVASPRGSASPVDAAPKVGFDTRSGVPTPAQARTAVVGAMVEAQRIRGLASWYCGDICTKGYPAGSMVAAAGSELRSPGWRGSWVTVTRGDRSVVVQLVDWCRCPGSRVIDLYGAAFERLADPSKGLIDVTVAVGGPVPTLPPTSTEGDK